MRLEKKYTKLSPNDTVKHRIEFNKTRADIFKEWNLKQEKMADIYGRCHFRKSRKGFA